MGAGVYKADASEGAAELTRKARPWVVRLARAGYAAKAVVYGIIGVVAAVAAYRGGGHTADSRGALAEILSKPFGSFLLGVVAVGLAGYAVWRLTQAALDTEDKGAKLSGLAVRTGYACIGFVYFGLAYSAVQLILGNGAGSSSDEKSRAWTATFMSFPFGRWAVGLAGLGVMGFGLYQCYKGYKTKFRKKLLHGEMHETTDTVLTRAGQVGLAARGVVFGLIGYFLIRAAFMARAGEARGLGGALRALEERPSGPWLLGAVALGLVAYALHMLLLARYRRIDV
jgi:Domain of Unknown Function (DUF1206)